MITMRVDSGLRKHARRMGRAGKQMPFALALTLTRIAQAAQSELKEDVTTRYVSRGTWVPRSIRIRPAKKGRRPESEVGTLYAPMADHVEGGRKTAQRGRMVGVPVYARRNKKDRTTRGKWPGRRLARDDTFARELEGGGIGIFQRLRGRRLRLWWILKDRVQIQQSWPWHAITDQVADKRLLPEFDRAWERANAPRGR